MRALRLVVISMLATVTALVFGCGSPPVNRFAASEQFPDASAQPGLTLSPCEYELDDVKYRADCGVLLVPENRQVPSSRLIPLPVRRLYSTNLNKIEPVFNLEGGPGLPNIGEEVPKEILANHDYVQVGYRGADGATRMDCPEVGIALVSAEHALSEQSAASVAEAITSCLMRMQADGHDLDGYNIVEVVNDLEAARQALGYPQVILKSGSYGTRLALLWAHMFPQSIKRSLISGANPPGGMVWSAEIVDKKLEQFADLCRQDRYCSDRTNDLTVSIRHAFEQVPDHWLVLPIDPDRVKACLFNMLYSTETAAAAFDTVLDAEQGDYSGFALFTLAYNFMFADALIWGDSIIKSASADYDQQVDEMSFTPASSIIGSPMSQLAMPFWRSVRGAGVGLIPEKYRGALTSDVETLVVVGDLDVATPLENAEEDVMPHLSNATLVVTRHAGHQDFVPGEKELRYQFMLSGKVDTSIIQHRTFSFEPSIDFSTIINLALLAFFVVAALLLWLAFYLVRRFRGKKKVSSLKIATRSNVAEPQPKPNRRAVRS